MIFQVPQFIDIEDKIVGPLTLKQFIYIAIAFGISFGLFFILNTPLWLFITIILSAFAGALAFAKVSGLDLPKVILSALKFYWQPHRYIWQHKIEALEKPEKEEEGKIKFKIPKISLPEIKMPKIPQIITRKLETKKPRLASGANLKNLSEKLMTTKNYLPNREKPFSLLKSSPKERYEVLRKITGEKISAKRVDYR